MLSRAPWRRLWRDGSPSAQWHPPGLHGGQTCLSTLSTCGKRDGLLTLDLPFKMLSCSPGLNLDPCYHQRQGLCIRRMLQSCLTLCNPIDGSPPGSPVPGVLQARTLEWVAISFSNARCARPSGVPRGPATSTGSLASQRHPGKFPKVPGRRRGTRGCVEPAGLCGRCTLRQTQRSPEGPRHLHRIPRLSEAPWEVP